MKYQNIQEAKSASSIVYNGLKNGAYLEHLVCALVEQNEMLIARLMEVELIAPRKVRGPDGTVWTYRCPDTLVPGPL